MRHHVHVDGLLDSPGALLAAARSLQLFAGLTYKKHGVRGGGGLKAASNPVHYFMGILSGYGRFPQFAAWFFSAVAGDFLSQGAWLFQLVKQQLSLIANSSNGIGGGIHVRGEMFGIPLHIGLVL